MNKMAESVLSFTSYVTADVTDSRTQTSQAPADLNLTTTVTTPLAQTLCETNIDFMCDPWSVGTFYFTIYGTMFAFILGIPGSFLTMVILWRMRPFNSSSVWLIVMSFTDLFSLTLRLVTSQVHSYNLSPWYDWSCRLFFILANVCEHSVYYFLVGLTLERFVAVCFPLRMAVWCTKRRAVVLIAAIQVVTLTFSLHFVETLRVNSYDLCVIKLKYAPTWKRLYQDYVINTFMLLLPVVLVISLNALIFIRLRTAGRFQRKISDQQSQSRDKQQRQINRILTAASVWFIVCVLLEIVIGFANDILSREDTITLRASTIVMNVSGVMRMYNHAANFVLYVIAARKFRSEVIRLVTCNTYVGIRKKATISSTRQ